MRVLKWLLYGAGGIVLLVVLAVVAALFIVDGTFVKNRLERKMKRGSAGVDRKCVARADRLGKCLFECLGLGAGGQPAAAQRLNDSFDLALTDTRQRKWNLERLRSAGRLGRLPLGDSGRHGARDHTDFSKGRRAIR